MPKTWLYFIAILVPLLFRLLMFQSVIEWFWYHHYEDFYYFLSGLSVQPQFMQLVGGWPFPIFIATVLVYWTLDEDDKDLGHQFLLLPLAYVPFAIIFTALFSRSFDISTLYSDPLVIIPFGYLYLLPWVICIWVFDKLRLVM